MPPRPRLIFKVNVVIEPIDRASTVYDRLRREPVKQAERSTAITIPAQVQWMTEDRIEPTRTGSLLKSTGYLIFRVPDFARLGYTPQRGDKITAIPGEEGIWFITAFEPCGHKRGTNNLLLAYFEDRAPNQVQ